MFTAGRHLFAVGFVLLFHVVITAMLTNGYIDTVRISPDCLCFNAIQEPQVIVDDWTPPPPVKLVRPRLALVKPPILLCEVPDDPSTVVPCDQFNQADK
jgi:hypothetical protein